MTCFWTTPPTTGVVFATEEWRNFAGCMRQFNELAVFAEYTVIKGSLHLIPWETRNVFVVVFTRVSCPDWQSGVYDWSLLKDENEDSASVLDFAQPAEYVFEGGIDCLEAAASGRRGPSTRRKTTLSQRCCWSQRGQRDQSTAKVFQFHPSWRSARYRNLRTRTPVAVMSCHLQSSPAL